MGLYDTKYYKKTRSGKWKLTKQKIEKAPHELGRWKQNEAIERKSQAHDKTYFVTAPTKSGLNQKVVKTTTYFEEGDAKVIRELITTSNKLPNRYRG